MATESEKANIKLRELNVKRSSIKGQITKFKNYLGTLGEEELNSIELAELSLRLNRFEGLSTKYDDLQSEIEVLNSKHLDDEIDEREGIEQDIISCIASAKRLIDNTNMQIETRRNTAWALLCERYDNKRLLINYHISELFNVQPITRESERSLRYLVDHVTKNLRALASLGQPTDKWDILLIYMLSSKLDTHSLRKWEEQRNSFDDVPTLDQFNKFLTDRSDVLESLNRNKYDNPTRIQQPSTARPNQGSHAQQSNAHNRPQVNNNPYSNNKHERTSYVKAFASANQNAQRKFECVICNDAHKVYQCPIFRNNNYNEKMAEVGKHNLCVNCLRQGHDIAECRLGPCMVCNKRHNTLLHHDTASQPASSATSHPATSAASHSATSAESVVTFSKQCPNEVILSTAIIEVSNPLTSKTEKVRALLDCGKPVIIFENYSRLSKLQRSFAYIKRFIFNLRNPLDKRSGSLTTNELKDSFRHLCSVAQSQCFPIEYKMLKHNLPLNSKSKILSLSPFLDENNIIRVGGRIDASNYPYEKKHPI
ncbi:Gag-pol polyprotein, partial [Operophtera brumata]